MSYKEFMKKLGLVSLFTIGLISSFYFIPVLVPHQLFSWACLLLFILLSYFMYVAGSKSIYHPNKGAFVSTSMLFNGLRVVLSITFLVVYYQVFQPKSHWFLLPYFIIYFIYTIFELYFLTKIGQQKS